MHGKIAGVIIAAVIAFGTACNTTGKGASSYNIVRHNYFSSRYHMAELDTNKVNRKLYAGVFEKVKPVGGAKCMLFRIAASGRMWEEYGLYDYANRRFYYTSSRYTLYAFKDKLTDESQAMYREMEKYIDSSRLLQNQPDQQGATLHDGAGFEASIIKVDEAQKEIIVSSYYW